MTKTEIIEAAFKIWGRNFYQKTSLSQLARGLGVSKPALYRHFMNKQALTSAMTERFLDDFSSSIQADFKKAAEDNDVDNGITTIVQSISCYFARNVYALIFSIINIYDHNTDGSAISEHLKSRGVDIRTLHLIIKKKFTDEEVLVQLILATLTFLMSCFHRINKSMENPPSDKEIQNITSAICKIIQHGLFFSEEKAAINFEKLEKQIEEIKLNEKPEPFFKAVAKAVAEAGPWNVSMDMVAKRLGLSKSSLYGHFKNRKDMLRRLFITEFKRIIEFAREGIRSSSDPAEQLYLGIFSISVYFHLHPEILSL